jgi:hypothetical protein
MKQRNVVNLASVAAIAGLLVNGACAESSGSGPPSAPSTTQATPAQPRLIAQEYVEGEATVEAVDRTKRTVTLKNAEGRTTTVQVPADVDLNRLKTGNKLLIGYHQSLSARVLPPGSAELGATLAAGSTAPGKPEGRAWGEQLTIVAEITAIDLVNHKVTVRGAQGDTRMITVKDPQMQQRMANLKVGDLVELTYAEAIAAKVMPMH